MYFTEVAASRWILLLAIGVAVVLSFIYLVFLRYFTGIFTWFMLLGYCAKLALLGYLFFSNYTGLTRYN
jgi:hypothetical protein